MVAVSNQSDALSELNRHSFDMAFLGIRLGAENGIAAFLLLAPGGKVPSDLGLLTSAIRVFQGQNLRRRVIDLNTPADILSIIREAETR